VRRDAIGQFKESRKPLELLIAISLDVGPAFGTGDHGAQGEGNDVQQVVQLGVVGAGVVKIGKMVQQGDGRVARGGHVILRDAASPRFPEGIIRCSLVQRQVAGQ
jgi:hypothetical protein